VAEGHQGTALAPGDRLTELPARLACLAAGSQRLHPSGPGFLDHVVNKKADIVRVYLPRMPTACCRWSTTACAAATTSMWWSREARSTPVAEHGRGGRALHGGDRHLGVASNDQGPSPMSSWLLRRHAHARGPGGGLDAAHPSARATGQVVNVVDLMKLQPSSEHPHGLSDADYDSLFTKDKHIIFGFHGYRG